MNSNQLTAAQKYLFSYSYNLAGSLVAETYPSGRTLTTSYDGANRPLSLSGQIGSTVRSYVAAQTYAPHGAMASQAYGNTLVRVQSYNNRLQPSQWYDANNNSASAYLFGASFNWGSKNNNGLLQGLQVSAGGGPSALANLPVYAATYTYDKLNRLTAATDTGWSRSFGYDSNGNVWLTGNSGVTVAGNTPTSNVFNANNQIAGNTYDAAGNQLTVNGNSVAYDAENHQITVTEPPSTGGAIESYLYDGLGQRVEKSGPTSAFLYVYDAFGQLAAEYYNGVPALQSPCTTCFLSYDHLGSVRLVTDQNGGVVSRHDYLPYGEEIPANVGGRAPTQFGAYDGISQRFTGRMRDSETGEDYFNARMFGSAFGRFTSPDPGNAGADLMNPQTWNAYSYAAGNPLSNVDPSGLNCVTLDGGGTGDDGQGTACPGSDIPSTTNVNGGKLSDIQVLWWFYGGVSNGLPFGSRPGDSGTTTSTAGAVGKANVPTVSNPPTTGPPAPSNRTPNKITCGTVLPNGRRVGSYVNQLSNGINGSAGNPTSTPYGPGPNPSAPGPISVARQVYSGTNFKILFRGQGNAAFLGDAGDFAYSAVSGNIGVPLSLTEIVAGGYALWAGHADATGPYFMDASATAQVPAGYSAGCKSF